MRTIIILDFADAEVHVLPFDEAKFDMEEITDFFDAANEEFDLSLKENQCQWMFSKENKPITINHR